MDLGPALHLTETSRQPCFTSVGQTIKTTQTDTEQIHGEAKACHKPELPTMPRAAQTSQPRSVAACSSCWSQGKGSRQAQAKGIQAGWIHTAKPTSHVKG